MAALRCGVDTVRLDLSALESVNQFDTNRIALCLGCLLYTSITTETNLQYELYLTGLDARLLRRHNRKPIYYVECEER